MANTIYDIIVIGGGASGLMFAANLNLKNGYGIRGTDTDEAIRRSDLSTSPTGLILEGSPKLGSKLLMSGGGRCNITHGGSVKDFLNAYGAAGSKLRRLIYKHSNLEFVKWLISRGLPLSDENGHTLNLSSGALALEGVGRIFPASMRARDVLDLLIKCSEQNGWSIKTNAKVSYLSPASDSAGSRSTSFRIETENNLSFLAQNIVIAGGGITYPETGSDGSLLESLMDLGIVIKEPRPALAPVYVEDYPYAELSGISIPDVTVTISFNGSAHAERQTSFVAESESESESESVYLARKNNAVRIVGDILFTQAGLSGPAILNLSKYAHPGDRLRLNYNRELSELPKRMQQALKKRATGPSGDVRTKLLTSLLKDDSFTISGTDPRGMVTAGGVSLDEIDLSTMRILSPFKQKAHEDLAGGIYVIGEAIDADGITGGYNLQLCYSTAAAAAESLSSF